MDPISLAYFAFIIPLAAAYAAYVIYRFRGKYKAQIKSVRADDLAAAYDYDISNEKPVPASDMREKE
jgi:hypothetical protein